MRDPCNLIGSYCYNNYINNHKDKVTHLYKKVAETNEDNKKKEEEILNRNKGKIKNKSNTNIETIHIKDP